MLHIRCLRTGLYYDLFADTVLSVSMESPAYLGGATAGMPIQGQFVYVFDMPLNTRITGYTHRIHDPRPLARDLPVEISVQEHRSSAGIALFSGILSLVEPFAHKVSVEIVINGLAGIREKPMNTLDLGSLPAAQTAVQASALATDTCRNPHVHDYVFYPVWNDASEAQTHTPDFQPNSFQNGCVNGIIANGHLTPHLKVSALLRRLFAAFGYAFQDNVLIGKELANLTLLNNASWNLPSLMLQDPFPLGYILPTYTFNRMMPTTPCNEYLRHLVRRMGAVMEVSAFDRVGTLTTFKAMQDASVQDWSACEVNPQERRLEMVSGERITAHSDQFFPSTLPLDVAKTPFFDELTMPSVMVPMVDAGRYRRNAVSYYWKRTRLNNNSIVQVSKTLLGSHGNAYERGSLPTEKPEASEYVSPFNQALLSRVPYGSGTMDVPSVRRKLNTPMTTAADWTENQSILCFYRGIYPTGYPQASCEKVGFDGAIQAFGQPAQHQTDACNGNTLFSENMQANFDFLDNRKQMTTHFKPSVKQLRLFSFLRPLATVQGAFLVAKFSFTISKRSGLGVLQATLLPNF